MEISGKFISGITLGEDYQVTIELPPVKFEDIKVGDEVWIKAIFDGNFPIGFPKHTIIAHFPQQPKPEPEKMIEELGKIKDSYGHYSVLLITELNQIIDKLNEIINYLFNGKELER